MRRATSILLAPDLTRSRPTCCKDWGCACRNACARLAKETIELIERMSRENRLWGAERTPD
jgi:hypothetical protein